MGGKPQVIPLDTVDNVGPAASIISNVTDLAKWVIVQLDSGRVGTTRLWSAAQTREMWTPQTIIPIKDPPAALAATRPNFFAYALGWRVRDYRGHKVVTHTGGLAGMASRTTLIPDQRLGIVMLTNGESSIYEALTYKLLDHFFRAPPTDWVSDTAQLRNETSQHGRAARGNEKLARHHHASVYSACAVCRAVH